MTFDDADDPRVSAIRALLHGRVIASTRPDLRERACAWVVGRLYGLREPRPRYMVFAAALLLVAPTLLSGFAFDDYLFIYQTSHLAHDEWAGRSPFDLFRWIDGGHLARLIDGQGLPWWTAAQTSVAFMRPLSSLSHALDHWLWPTNAVAMHVHSLVWFACLLLIAMRTYAELSRSGFVMGVASAMFAIDSAHGAAVGWISNRNALLGGVFGISTLLLHHLGRSGRGRRYAVLAWTCFALGLGSWEAAIGFAGYLLAYALCIDRGAQRARAASLLPYVALAGGWSWIRHATHHGVIGLAGYLDPFKMPLAFLHTLPRRVVALFAGQIARVCADLFESRPAAQQPLFLLGATAICGVAVWAIWPALRADRHARFWACGALFSALPLAAATPSDRLLTPVGLGVMAALAHLMREAFEAAREPAQTLTAWLLARRRDVALALTLIHFVIDPLLLPWIALAPSVLARTTRAIDASLTSDPILRDQTVIVASIPESWMLSYLPVMRSLNGKPRPARLHWLLATEAQAHFERVGRNVLRARVDQGAFDDRWFERNSMQPLHAGDHVTLSEMSVNVVEVTPDGRPRVCDFAFKQPLESPEYRWLTYRNGELVPFPVPLQR